MTEKKVYNEKDSDLMNKIKQAVEGHKVLSGQVKSPDAKNKIIFFAFPDEKPRDKMRQIQMEEGNGKLQIKLCKWVNGKNILKKPRQEQGDIDLAGKGTDAVLKDICDRLKTFKNPDNWVEKEVNKVSKEQASVTGKPKKQKPAKLQNEPKDEVEAEFIEAIEKAKAKAKRNVTAPDKRFWKTDVNPWINVENPCIDVERKRKYHEGTYILEDDFATVKKYLGKGGKRIRAEVLPQPYIGDPDAPIWILSMNPSYSAVDVYDMKDCGRDAKMAVLLDMGYDEQTSKKLLQHNVFPHDREEDLKKRKGLMQSQLSFSSTEFYVLNPAFDTVPTNDEIQKAGVQSTNQTYNKGSYRWWKKYLFESNICSPDGVNRDNEEECRNNLRNFFVLESFPYHSENFDSGKEFFNDVVSLVRHYEFWKKMVEFALKKGKILLCRGENIPERVSQIAMDKKMSNAQIYVFSSLRSLWISTGNFQKYQRK